MPGSPPLSYNVPSDTHQVGDTGHVTDHDHIADDLTLIVDALPVVSGGLTGATAATRYAGGTTSGAPAAGAFLAGDFVIDETGVMWICTTSGSPGTWANAGASAGVSSFNSRSGSVVPGNADYLAVSTSGLTGATAATRYAGATTSGAPGSGTFAKGDFVIDQSGTLWICTTAGTPGTWGALAALGLTQTITGAKTFTGLVAMEATAGTNELVISTDGTATSQGAFVVQTGTNGFAGIYDQANSLYYGISHVLPAPSGTSVLGGYFKGLGVGGGSNGSGNPIFGVLTSTQSGSGKGNVAMTVTDTNVIYSYNSTLDDGSGNATIAGTLTTTGLQNINAGTDTAGSAPIITGIGATSTVAKQLSDTTRDYMVYLEVTTSGTATSLTMGHTSGASDVTLVSSAAATAGTLWSFRLPAGWYFKWGGTTTAIGNQNAVGC